MNKNKNKLVSAAVLMIIYLLYNFIYMICSDSLVSENNLDNILNIIFFALGIGGTIYFLVLSIKNIDLSKHYRGILVFSIIFFIINLVSGIIGFVLYSNIEKNKEVRELPKIEFKQYTNKYICLAAFIACLIILFVLFKYVNSYLEMVIMYLSIIVIMISVFFKQLVSDFKIFKQYFKEYISLTFKTWLKSLVVVCALSLLVQLITGTSNSNNQQNLQNMFNVSPILIALLSTIYAPIAEELMFRGVIRKFINNKYLYIVISGVLFGLMHVIDDSNTLAEFSYVIVYSALGFYLSNIYYDTNNIFTNISFHFMQNALGVIGMILLKFM